MGDIGIERRSYFDAGRILDRRRFLKLGGASIAGLAFLRLAKPASGDTSSPAPAFGISKDNTAAQNRESLVKVLSYSNSSMVFPSGDYLVDNSGSPVAIRNFTGKLTMEPGARFVFTDSTTRGLVFQGGSGAELRGVTSTFETLPSSRVNAQACIAFMECSDTIVEDIYIHGSAAGGLFFGKCVNSSVYGATIQDTMADGLNFTNCSGVRADRILAENTGDDGLAFLRYAGGDSDLGGGLATNVVVRDSGTRGITVIGQKDVTVENFRVENSFSSGVLVAHEAHQGFAAPLNIRFAHGNITNAGRGERGNGSGTGNKYGVEYSRPESVEFSDIEVVSPATRGVSGSAPEGVVRLSGIRVRGAPASGFDLHGGNHSLYDLTSEGSGGTGFHVADSQSVSYGDLWSVNSSKQDALRRAFSFERNGRIAGRNLNVVDNQRRATGYKVSAYGEQTGTLGSVRDRVAATKIRLENPSRLSYRLRRG